MLTGGPETAGREQRFLVGGAAALVVMALVLALLGGGVNPVSGVLLAGALVLVLATTGAFRLVVVRGALVAVAALLGVVAGYVATGHPPAAVAGASVFGVLAWAVLLRGRTRHEDGEAPT